MTSSAPSIGQMIEALVAGLREASTPDDKVALLRAMHDVFAAADLHIVVQIPDQLGSEPIVHIAVPDHSSEVAKWFANTPWANGGWSEPLQQMPGASCGLLNMLEPLSSATFLPLPTLAEVFGFGTSRQ